MHCMRLSGNALLRLTKKTEWAALSAQAKKEAPWAGDEDEVEEEEEEDMMET